jgi:hypothetical protein
MAQDEEETLVVTSVNTRGWKSNTGSGGTLAIVSDPDPTSPALSGSLKLTTNNTVDAYATYSHATETPIADVSELSYWAKQNLASFADGNAAYFLRVCLDPLTSPVTDQNPLGCTGYTSFIYEPYWNMSGGMSAWREYDVDAGQMWSSRSYSSGTCTVTAGAGGPPLYTLGAIQTACPNAVVVEFGVNIGTYNPSYDISVDLVKFNNTTYDFEVYSTPTTAEDCKKGGWSTFNPPAGQFKNQGQCVSSTVPAN